MTGNPKRHVPLRRCAVCRKTLPQAQLIRLARDEAGAWLLDESRKASGRGIWLCTESSCHERKALGRAFRAQAAAVAEQLAARTAGDRERSQARTSQNGGIDV